MHWEAALSTETFGHNSVDPRSNGLFGVYVHWPFCAAKCPYCDFNSHVHRGEFDEQTYVCLLYTSPSPRDGLLSRMPSSA